MHISCFEVYECNLSFQQVAMHGLKIGVGSILLHLLLENLSYINIMINSQEINLDKKFREMDHNLGLKLDSKRICMTDRDRSIEG